MNLKHWYRHIVSEMIVVACWLWERFRGCHKRQEIDSVEISKRCRERLNWGIRQWFKASAYEGPRTYHPTIYEELSAACIIVALAMLGQRLKLKRLSIASHVPALEDHCLFWVCSFAAQIQSPNASKRQQHFWFVASPDSLHERRRRMIFCDFSQFSQGYTKISRVKH